MSLPPAVQAEYDQADAWLRECAAAVDRGEAVRPAPPRPATWAHAVAVVPDEKLRRKGGDG